MAVDVMAGIRRAAKGALHVLRKELAVVQEKIDALERLAGVSNGKVKAGRPKGSSNKANTKGKGGSGKKKSQAESNEYAIKLVKDSGKEWPIRDLNARIVQD